MREEAKRFSLKNVEGMSPSHFMEHEVKYSWESNNGLSWINGSIESMI